VEKKIERKCWICNVTANTREHRAKKSDLLPLFELHKGAYLNSEKHKNLFIQGPNSKLLKFGKSLCESCNSSLTQPYDLAWQALSKRLKVKISDNATDVDWDVSDCFEKKHRMKRLRQCHLFFVKWLGCQLYEENVEFSQLGFSESLMQAKAHPNLYLKFGNSHRGNYVGQSDLEVNFTGKVINHAYQVYFAGQNVEVHVVYSRTNPGEFIELDGSWHPRMGTTFNFIN